MINLNLSQDSKITFSVGVVGTKAVPNIVRLTLGNSLIRLSFEASPNSDTEWSVVIPAMPELVKYMVGPVRIKIEAIVNGRFFVPFDKELSVDNPSSVSFDVSNMTVTGDGVIVVQPTVPAEEEEEEEVATEKHSSDDVEVIRIIEPKTEAKKVPVLSREMLLGEHISKPTPPKEAKKPQKKYYLKPLKTNETKDVDISAFVKNVIKEESKKPVVSEDKKSTQTKVARTKKEETPFKLIKKNIVEK